MSSPNVHTPSSEPPTGEQLAASRRLQWHQGGEALLTFENLRSWLNATGLVLFTARPGQLPAPAPSLVEAVLGAANANPVMADQETAKSLLARAIAEGIAVPLNLLGTPGETPDFVASAAVFSYVFTLRGDKAWKQPPVTSGAVKVSPLALATYTLLTERVTLSAYDLATQLGKEVTESAVLRSLNELWVHLRVLPVPQPDGAATLWELTSGRFTKLMKAGANAGQPSALSALISLYLNTAVVASEEEIETFLSPLAARSRIRDVVHALMAARQLETLAVEGKTVLHVAGELPGFLAPAGSILIDREAVAEEAGGAAPAEGAEPSEGAERITKFVPKPRKVGTGFVNKPVAKPTFGKREPGADRERRPFVRGGAGEARPERAGGPAKPSFTKPWQEGRPARAGADEAEGAARKYPARPRVDRGGERPAFGKRPSFGDRPAFGGRPAGGFAERREDGGGTARPPRREFTPREGAASGEGRPERKSFGKQGGFAGKPSFGRGGDTARPPRREFAPREGGAGEARPPRREFAPREGGAGEARPPRRDFAPREGGAGEARPPRREFAPRPDRGDRPAFGGARKPGSFGARAGGDRPFTPREGGSARPRSFAAGAEGAPADRRSRTAGPPFRKFDAPRQDRGERPARPEGAGPRAGFAGKPAGGFGGKRPGSKFAGKPAGGFKGKQAAGKPAGTFDKFKNNAKPFGNRPPAKKYRPEEGEPSA